MAEEVSDRILPVLKTAAPDQVEFAYKSLFGESEVYLKQKKLTKQLTLLEKMYSNASFEKFKPLVAEKLEENYLAQASQANLAENPENTTKFLEKAIEIKELVNEIKKII